jgi:hypothetical protein
MFPRIKITGITKMPSRKQKQPPITKNLTLEDALDYIYNLANADGTKKIWSNAIINIAAFDNPSPSTSTMKVDELEQHFKDTNIATILNDFDRTVDVIENKIKNKQTGGDLSPETIKQYYLAIFRISQNGGAMKLDKDTREKYSKKYKEFDAIGNKKHDQNIPKRGNAENPDLTWTKVQQIYDEYITTHKFTNTENGRKELRWAVIAGMYILRPPRRVEDYELLQFYSKMPSAAEQKDRNFVVIEKDKATLYIDEFKIQHKVKGSSNKKREVMPRYEKELPPRLTSLSKDYISKRDIPDNAKLKQADKKELQKRDKQRRDDMIAAKVKTLPKETPVGYFVFFKETGEKDEKIAEGVFSKVVATAPQKVLGRKNITANTMRHAWNTWLVEHMSDFTDEQIKQFAIDVGDTPKNLPTHLRYRHANQKNVGTEKTEIVEGLHGDKYVKEMMNEQEEEGSVGDIGEIDEVVSPKAPINVVVDNDEEALYRRLAELEVEKIKIMVKLMKM